MGYFSRRFQPLHGDGLRPWWRTVQRLEKEQTIPWSRGKVLRCWSRSGPRGKKSWSYVYCQSTYVLKLVHSIYMQRMSCIVIWSQKISCWMRMDISGSQTLDLQSMYRTSPGLCVVHLIISVRRTWVDLLWIRFWRFPRFSPRSDPVQRIQQSSWLVESRNSDIRNASRVRQPAAFIF